MQIVLLRATDSAAKLQGPRSEIPHLPCLNFVGFYDSPSSWNAHVRAKSRPPKDRWRSKLADLQGSRHKKPLKVLMVPSSSGYPYLAQKVHQTPILRSHSCAAFPVEFFISEKMSTIYTLPRLWTFQKKSIRLTLIPLRLCKGSGFFKNEI